ncbi:MAG: hypothetical protein JKX85_01885 [Phycisphaeraceae bacterium]|nr:hypothetical protein [Phycisphaeraceae bacterium]
MQNPSRFLNWLQHPALLTLICSLLVLPGCGEEEIDVYEAPHAAVAPNATAHDPQDGQDHSGHNHGPEAQQATTSQKLSFTLPQGWQQTEPGNMVLHRFVTPSQANLAITAFPGDVGGTIANVNRWRGQLGLPTETDAQVTAALKPDKLGKQEAHRIDLANDSKRLVVTFGMINGKTWFFKLTGTSDQIEKALPAFGTFLTSVNWQ